MRANTVRCDLLSDLFFTIFATAYPCSYRTLSLLWFAFRFIFYDICNSLAISRSSISSVVICFQIYFLRYLQQRLLVYAQRRLRCDLLSDLFFTIFATANQNLRAKFGCCDLLSDLFFTIFATALMRRACHSSRCDLLSDLFFTIFATAFCTIKTFWSELWFAFRFIFYDICNSKLYRVISLFLVVICFQIYFLRYLQQHIRLRINDAAVVICFQIYFLRYLQQQFIVWIKERVSCDLLSDLFFTIFATAETFAGHCTAALWFAFRFIFYDICNSTRAIANLQLGVVICFQIYFLRYLQQRLQFWWGAILCCDLLSDLFFTIFATAFIFLMQQRFRLWFAFRFIFYDICNSMHCIIIQQVQVVICFQIYFLRYLQQLEGTDIADARCCDLLSDLFFTIFATAASFGNRARHTLWFAFRFIFYDICNSERTNTSEV